MGRRKRDDTKDTESRVSESQVSKFNVSKDVGKRTCDGIVFDSAVEMRYYKEIVLPYYSDGTITKYELQKPYELQPKFEHDGKMIRPIIYVADFYLEYADRHIEVIDTKGFADTTALMKRKMFWYTYPDIIYKWMVYVKKFGGWLEYDECQRLRREEKRLKKLSSKNEDSSSSDAVIENKE